MWCFGRKSSNHSQHQSPFSLLSHGDDASVAEARAFRRHASLKKCLNRFGIKVGRKRLDFSRFSSQVVPIVNDAVGAGITERPRGVATDTRSPESTHLMSKSFPRELGLFPHYTDENGLGLVPGDQVRGWPSHSRL